MVTTIEEKHLKYFKKLLEGNAQVSFVAYIKHNQDALREQLSRAQFLRLKFQPIDEIQNILINNEISYEINPLAVKTEKYLMTFHPDVLDEYGKIKKSHKESLFNGVIKFFEEGKIDLTTKALNDFIGFPKNICKKKYISNIEDVEGFAEIELKYGDEKIGLFLLEKIAAIDRQNSDVDDSIIKAKYAINEYKKTSIVHQV